jgi:dTDP-4-dehydrorhamnose 3,5-epimerase
MTLPSFNSFRIKNTEIPGCFEIQPKVFSDKRGAFVKTFHSPEFEALGLCTDWKEQYYSTSAPGVLRGIHFQTPPHDHVKLVYCLVGSVLDVAVDLRKGSPTYGGSITLKLSAKSGNMIYLPPGVAHGFCTETEPAILVYSVNSVFNYDCDSGIRWDSVGIKWPINSPTLSERDKILPQFKDFQSPFVFESNDP